MRLHLDGAYALHQFMEAEKGELRKQGQKFTDGRISSHTLRAHKVWSRISQPLHFALIIIRTLGIQACRGTSSIVSGVLTLDIHRDGKLVSGLNDYLSVVVQAIVLPLLGIGAIFKPKAVSDRLGQIVERLDVSMRTTWGAISQLHRFQAIPGVQTFFVKVPMMITAIPAIALRRSTQGVQELLKGRFSEAGSEFRRLIEVIGPFFWLRDRCDIGISKL